MGYAVGIVLALVVCVFARVVGFERDRAFYPTAAVVIASYYVLFAVMGGSSHALVLELLVMGGFVTLAVMGFKGSPWLVIAAIAGHGIQDFFHAGIVVNPGVPEWWPAFCGSFDVVMGAVLAGRYFAGSIFRTAPKVSSVNA